MAIKRTEHEKEKEILRKKIISVLKEQGFAINPHLSPVQPTKDGYKKLQAKSRQEQLSIHKKFLKEFMGTAKMFLTDGENIDPQKIILEPREVKRRSFEEKLSRWWNLIWWSIPYQHPMADRCDFCYGIQADANDTNKHNAKYYSLTEFSIYQLFLNKLNGLHIRQLDTIKFNKPPSSNTLIFFRNYHNSLLFESFLYPYFEKDTLFAIGNYLLWDLYNYLADCCHRIKQKLKYYGYSIPVYNTIFYWNRIQAHDKNQAYNKELLLHLKEQFDLESLDSCEIKKIGDTITVKTSTAPIILKYDRDTEEVIVMSTVGGKYKEMKYSTSKLGSDILVSVRLPNEKLLEDIVGDVNKQMQQIIYEFVYDLSSSASNPEKSQEFSYYCKILSQDKKFMDAVEDIYKNRHKGFEKGYLMLNNNI